MSKLTNFLKKVGGYRVSKSLSYLQLEHLIPKLQVKLAMKGIRKVRWEKMVGERLNSLGYDKSDIEITSKALEFMREGTERETAYQMAIKLVKGRVKR